MVMITSAGPEAACKGNSGVDFAENMKIRVTKMAQQAKASAVQDWEPELNPWNPCDDTRREPTPEVSYPLTSTCML